ncbi:MAG: hypothetical protein AAF360_18450 [Pseudomonadota bacterium]
MSKLSSMFQISLDCEFCDRLRFQRKRSAAAIGRAIEFMPHQFNPQALIDASFKLLILNRMAEAVGRVVWRLSQSLARQVLVDRRRLHIALYRVARQAAGGLQPPRGVGRYAKQRQLTLGLWRAFRERPARGRMIKWGVSPLTTNSAGSAPRISNGQAPVVTIIRKTSRASPFIPASAPGASSRVGIQSLQSGGTSAPGGLRLPSKLIERRFQVQTAEVRDCAEHVQEMPEVFVRRLCAHLAGVDAVLPPGAIGRRIGAGDILNALLRHSIVEIRHAAFAVLAPAMDLLIRLSEDPVAGQFKGGGEGVRRRQFGRRREAEHRLSLRPGSDAIG